jgi:hypothetical protein
MRAEFLESFDGHEWEECITGLDGNVMHYPAVLMTEDENARLAFLRVHEGSRLVAAAVGRRVRSRTDRILNRGPWLHFPTAPAMQVESDGAASILECIAGEARRQGYDRLVMGHVWSRDFRSTAFVAGAITSSVVEFVIDLSLDRQTLVSRMHKVHRKNIRRADELGVTVVSDPSLEGLKSLRQLQILSAERSHDGRPRFGVQDERYFERLHRHVYSRGTGDILFALDHGERVAGLAYLVSRDRAVTVRSGASARGYEVYAMYALTLALIDRLAGLGFKELNIGGTPLEAECEGHPEHGLYKFKAGFGGRSCVRNTIELRL